MQQGNGGKLQEWREGIHGKAEAGSLLTLRLHSSLALISTKQERKERKQRKCPQQRPAKYFLVHRTVGSCSAINTKQQICVYGYANGPSTSQRDKAKHTTAHCMVSLLPYPE